MFKHFIVVLVLIISQASYAAFMAEPILGVAAGSVRGTDLNGSTLTPTVYETVGLGVRLGYRWGNIWSGLEGSSYMGNGKANSATYDITSTDMGVLVGYDSTKFRFYGGYVASVSLKQKQGSSEATLTGTGFKIGGGYFVKPRVSINVEYVSHAFSKVSTGTVERKVSEVYGSLKDDPFLVIFGYMF